MIICTETRNDCTEAIGSFHIEIGSGQQDTCQHERYKFRQKSIFKTLIYLSNRTCSSVVPRKQKQKPVLFARAAYLMKTFFDGNEALVVKSSTGICRCKSLKLNEKCADRLRSCRVFGAVYWLAVGRAQWTRHSCADRLHFKKIINNKE